MPKETSHNEANGNTKVGQARVVNLTEQMMTGCSSSVMHEKDYGRPLSVGNEC